MDGIGEETLFEEALAPLVADEFSQEEVENALALAEGNPKRVMVVRETLASGMEDVLPVEAAKLRDPSRNYTMFFGYTEHDGVSRVVVPRVIVVEDSTFDDDIRFAG